MIWDEHDREFFHPSSFILHPFVTMRLRLIWVGKTKDARLRALCDDYLTRLSHFVRCEVTELKEGKAEGIEKESKRISDALHEGTVTVLLDPAGRQWSSAELAEQVQRWNNQGTREVSFVIGGPQGLAPELMKAADKHWSLSRLTLTHEMARVLLLEQLYRAYTIIHNLPYQK
jgi:23S rRNA (pseudouridine1915-N3)-methyltransferase